MESVGFEKLGEGSCRIGSRRMDKWVGPNSRKKDWFTQSFNAC
jgi:hypothetical protein